MNLRDKIESNLAKDEYVFDPEKMVTIDICRLESLGLYPVCWRCGSRLEYALTPTQAKSKKIAPGVVCPQRSSHLQIAVNFSRD